MTPLISSSPAIQSQPGTPPAAPATQTAAKVDRYARMIFTIGDRFFEVTLEGVSATREQWTQLRALLSSSLSYHYEKFHIPKEMSIGIAQVQDQPELLLIGDETTKVEPLRTQYRDYLANSLKALKAHRATDPTVPHRTLMLADPTPQLPPAQQPQTTPPAQQRPQAPERGSDIDSAPGASAGVPTTRRKAPSNEDEFFSPLDSSSDFDLDPNAPSPAAAEPAMAAASLSEAGAALANARASHRSARPKRPRRHFQRPIANAEAPAAPKLADIKVLDSSEAEESPAPQPEMGSVRVLAGTDSDTHQYDNPLEEDLSGREVFLSASDGDDSLGRAPDYVD